MRIKSAPNSTKAEHIKLLERVQAENAARGVRTTQNKLLNRWTTCRYGHRHQSMKESVRCEELELWQRVGLIEGLNRKVRFHLLKTWWYESDFTYWVLSDQIIYFVIEDSKGRQDKKDLAYRLFRLKADLVEQIYEIRILES